MAHRSIKPALPSRRAPDAASVHRIPPRVHDDRDTPLEWDETAGLIDVIWVFGEGKSFWKRDWTGRIELIPQENFFSIGTRNRRPLAGHLSSTQLCRSGRGRTGRGLSSCGQR